MNKLILIVSLVLSAASAKAESTILCHSKVVGPNRYQVIARLVHNGYDLTAEVIQSSTTGMYAPMIFSHIDARGLNGKVIYLNRKGYDMTYNPLFRLEMSGAHQGILSFGINGSYRKNVPMTCTNSGILVNI